MNTTIVFSCQRSMLFLSASAVVALMLAAVFFPYSQAYPGPTLHTTGASKSRSSQLISQLFSRFVVRAGKGDEDTIEHSCRSSLSIFWIQTPTQTMTRVAREEMLCEDGLALLKAVERTWGTGLLELWILDYHWNSWTATARCKEAQQNMAIAYRPLRIPMTRGR